MPSLRHFYMMPIVSATTNATEIRSNNARVTAETRSLKGI